MKRTIVSIILSFLLFSVVAETCSSLFVTRTGIVLTDDDSAPEEKPEKEENLKNKISGNFITMQCRDNYLAAAVILYRPCTTKDTRKCFLLLPEQPPRPLA